MESVDTPLSAAAATIIQGLKNKNESTRSKSIENLYKHIQHISQEIFGETYLKYMHDVAKSLTSLIQSHDATEKVSAILAIEKLIDIEEDPINKILRYAPLLRPTLPSNDPHICLLSSRTLGTFYIHRHSTFQ
jgi:hypothetical protein